LSNNTTTNEDSRTLSFKLRKGLNLPVAGPPSSDPAEDGPIIRTVALLGADYIDLKPRLSVQEGDVVAAGAPIFAHKDTPNVQVVSPVSGKVKAVNRGHRRALISVEIEVDDAAASPVDFSSVGDINTVEGLTERLCASGLWTSFRTRPYSKVPASDAKPTAIFVTAMDTEPHAPNPATIVRAEAEAFKLGLAAISKLTDGKTYLCHETGEGIPGADSAEATAADFSGPHPAGLPGTHINFLEPPTGNKSVWTIWYQDVIAIGHLLETGKINSERVISLSGPLCTSPRLIKTIAGASMAELTEGEFDDSTPARIISGSILSGRAGDGPRGYLGRYAGQVSVIEEDTKQIPLGWIRPMSNKFAVQPVLGPSFSKKLQAFTSNLNGGRRAMVPIGTFEELMPQDFLPTQLLRALLVMDTDEAQALGALELDEEDLALVSFACPAKYEYGMALRDCLTKIEKEG